LNENIIYQMFLSMKPLVYHSCENKQPSKKFYE
jgi:hypothetical protein